MLRAPLLRHPLLAASSMTILARCASQIIRIYHDLFILGRLDPNWIQLQRIITCGHVIVITCSEGHIQPAEAMDLLSFGIEMVRAHDSVSSFAIGLSEGIRSARDALLSNMRGIQENRLATSQAVAALEDPLHAPAANHSTTWTQSETDWLPFWTDLAASCRASGQTLDL